MTLQAAIYAILGLPFVPFQGVTEAFSTLHDHLDDEPLDDVLHLQDYYGLVRRRSRNSRLLMFPPKISNVHERFCKDFPGRTIRKRGTIHDCKQW